MQSFGGSAIAERIEKRDSHSVLLNYSTAVLLADVQCSSCRRCSCMHCIAAGIFSRRPRQCRQQVSSLCRRSLLVHGPQRRPGDRVPQTPRFSDRPARPSDRCPLPHLTVRQHRPGLEAAIASVNGTHSERTHQRRGVGKSPGCETDTRL